MGNGPSEEDASSSKQQQQHHAINATPKDSSAATTPAKPITIKNYGTTTGIPSPRIGSIPMMESISFVPVFHVEHWIDAEQDSVASLALQYNLSLISLKQANYWLTQDDDIFIFKSVLIPVQDENCEHAKCAHSALQQTYKGVGISDLAARKDNSKQRKIGVTKKTTKDSYIDAHVQLQANDNVLIIKDFYWPASLEKKLHLQDDVESVEICKVDALRGSVIIPSMFLYLQLYAIVIVFEERFCFAETRFKNGLRIMEKNKRVPIFIVAESIDELFGLIKTRIK